MHGTAGFWLSFRQRSDYCPVSYTHLDVYKRQEYYVVKFTVPKKFVGYFVNELNLDGEFHLKLIGLKRADKITNCLGISLTELHVKNNLPEDEKVNEGDELVCYGKYRDFQAFSVSYTHL